MEERRKKTCLDHGGGLRSNQQRRTDNDEGELTRLVAWRLASVSIRIEVTKKAQALASATSTNQSTGSHRIHQDCSITSQRKEISLQEYIY